MSYSIATSFSTEEQKNKMFSFLSLHYKEPLPLLGIDAEPTVSRVTDTLSYPDLPHPFLLGFHYQSSDFERAYIYRICFWMAEMCGEKKNAVHGESLPFAIYDGYEYFFLTKQDRPKNEQSDNWLIEIDEYGFSPIDKRLSFLLMDYDIPLKTGEEIVRNELIRLTNEWKHFDVSS